MFQSFFLCVFCTQCLLEKDHLWDCSKVVLKTTFEQSQRWSYYRNFTVFCKLEISPFIRKRNSNPAFFWIRRTGFVEDTYLNKTYLPLFDMAFAFFNILNIFFPSSSVVKLAQQYDVCSSLEQLMEEYQDYQLAPAFELPTFKSANPDWTATGLTWP